MKKEVIRASAVLTGCVIGAGILGIPYVVARAGFLTGLLDILFLGVMIMILNLYLGEIVLRTKKKHQLTGYADKYLGFKGRATMFFSTLIVDYGALVAYLIGEGEVLSVLFGFPPLIWSFIFFVIASSIVYIGIKGTSFSELIATFGMILIVIVLALISFNHIDISNLMEFNILSIGIPYGVVIFAFLGLVAVPEVREVLGKNRKDFKKAIIIGSIIPIIIYSIFAFVVVGITGLQTTPIATVGLGELLGKSALFLGNLFAVFAMFTSFLAISLALKGVFHYDFKLNKFISFLLATIVPLLLFLLLRNTANFTSVLNVAGFLAGGLIGLLVLGMTFFIKKGDRNPEYKMSRNVLIKILIAIILIGGIAYNLINL